MLTSDRLTALVREVLGFHMLQMGHDPMVVVNGDGRIILASRSVALLGWADHDLIGRSWDDLVVFDDDVPAAPLMLDAERVAPWSATCRVGRVHRGDAGRTEREVLSYLIDVDGSVVYAVMVLRPVASTDVARPPDRAPR